MVNPEPIQKQVKIILPEDWDKDTNKKGEFLELLVADLLSKMKFTVEKRVNLTGMEIDIIAKNLGTNKQAFIECKFIKNPFSADVILITPTQHLWVAEEIKEGDTEPFRVILFPTSEKCYINK
jgi:hypothetical protein